MEGYRSGAMKTTNKDPWRRPRRQNANGLRKRLDLCRKWQGTDTPKSYAAREGVSHQSVLDLIRAIRIILEIPNRQRVDFYWLTSLYLEKFGDEDQTSSPGDQSILDLDFDLDL